MPNEYKQLQKIVGHRFNDITLLERALTHKSYAAETGGKEFNERMEFLGDSILSASVADFLYHKYPDQAEGKLSQLKSQIVSRPHLSKWARDMKLGNFMLISKGEDLNGGRSRDSLLSNTFEAVIAALYLDGGFAAANEFILSFLRKHKRLVVNDPKSKLQETIQSEYQTLPEYRVIKETGPDHDKLFEIGVFVKKKLMGVGTGRSKKDAEQMAARKALREINSHK